MVFKNGKSMESICANSCGSLLKYDGQNWLLIILWIFPKYTRRSFQINKLIMRFVCEYHFRLDYEENYETSKTYAKYRILIIITFFIWGALAMFCRQRVYAIISRICPGGNLAVIGGRKKRNILTLGTRIPDKYYFSHFSYSWVIVL